MKVITDAGQTFDLGVTEMRPTIGITDYSRRVTDDFGVTTVVPRGFSRRLSVRLGVPVEEVDALQQRLASLRATSARWVADARFASLAVDGCYKDFDIDVATAPLSYCTLTVEGIAEATTFADPGGDPAPFGTSTLRMLRPIVIDDAALVASSVSETDHAAWSAGTTYAKGARVQVAGKHRVYESLAAGNVGADPTGTSGKWLDVGPTNRWAAFDQALGTATTTTGSITVTLAGAAIDAVALLDVVATTVRVQASGYDQSRAAGAGAITFLDLPAGTARVTVTITGSGTVSVGTLLAGTLVGLGVTEASPTAGITDYSRKVVDDFGAVTIVERAWAKRMTARALIDTGAIDTVFGRIADVRATPVLWIGSQGRDCLTIYGFFRDFSIEVGETVSKLSLSIEGLSKAGKTAPLVADAVAWSAITDPEGTKPADNATNSADLASAFGTGSVGSVLEHLTTLDDAIEQVREDLGGAEGATQAAIAARDAAQLAATNAATARDASRSARDAAQKASGDALASAGAAAGSAGAAEGQAKIASSKADAATEQAKIATGKAEIATTKAGDASTSATSAATSERNASGSATAAATSAQVTASTYQKVIGAVGNEHFDQGTDGWENVGDIQAVATSYGRTNVIRTTPGVKYDYIVGRKVPVTSDSQRFRLSASWRCAAQTAMYFFGAVFFDGSGNIVAATDGTGNYPLGPAVVLDASKHGWLDRSIVIGRGYVDGQYGGTAGIPAGTVYFRPVMYLNYTSVDGSVSEVDYFTVEDVTLEVNAGGYAKAAATSASSAAASQKGAEQKASAAESSSTNAQTAAGNAATYRDQASTSATNAAGSASTATTQATLSAGSARDAASSASAASTSASTAESKADAAGSSASAAATSAQEARGYRDGAATSASSASSSAASADGSRSSAQSFAEQAASYSGTAGTHSANARSYYESTVGATGSLSQKVDTLSTSVGGVENTLKQQSASITAANGRTTVYWEVLGTTGDGKTRVRLSKSDGSRGVFYVDADMVLDGGLILSGTIRRAQVGAAEITTMQIVRSGDYFDGTPRARTVLSYTLYVPEACPYLFVAGCWLASYGDNYYGMFELYVDGNRIGYSQTYNLTYQDQPIIAKAMPSLAAGNHTIRLDYTGSGTYCALPEVTIFGAFR